MLNTLFCYFLLSFFKNRNNRIDIFSYFPFLSLSSKQRVTPSGLDQSWERTVTRTGGVSCRTLEGISWVEERIFSKGILGRVCSKNHKAFKLFLTLYHVFYGTVNEFVAIRGFTFFASLHVFFQAIEYTVCLLFYNNPKVFTCMFALQLNQSPCFLEGI